MSKQHEQASFSTIEIQTIGESFEDDFGVKNTIPKEHPKACCCCAGSAAVILPKSEKSQLFFKWGDD